ncbi:MAG: hypothetical protein IT446_05680 [Phycisphaerales bacterium]|nr:hypothetical protein [Phycisphaerales bacterium]
MTTHLIDTEPTFTSSLRDYWLDLNRQARAMREHRLEQMKAVMKGRPKCRCHAYPWPHRPGGGLCRWPDPPTEIYQRKKSARPYRQRYAGLVKQICRNNGLHPIKDKAAIQSIMPTIVLLARELKRREPRAKYRNMELTSNGSLKAVWQTAGPCM